MHEYCHRCGGTLVAGDGGSTFCPHCGAPQLYLPDHTVAGPSDATGSTGILPPPRPRKVDWKTAILCAGAVALVGALLSVISSRVPALIAINWLWILCGAAIALGLYQRRRPQAWMDASVGARIGVVAGLGLIASIALSMAAVGLVARFALHSMGGFDADLHAQIEKAIAANPQPAEVMRHIKSPEFRAGLMLGGFAMMAGFIMLASTIGGALSGMLRTRRQ
ncbi:MAG: zinc ribbon domain-containing protein [Acidobacteria bacterium]|nr:zinc ribbon domain-containing protein [Acidobacteriota bacterium]